MDLHSELSEMEDLELHSLVLRSSWKYIVPKAIPFLTSMLFRVPRLVNTHQIDTVLFSSMTTALPAMRIASRLRQAGARVAAICHGLDVTEPNAAYQLGVRRTLRQLDAVLPVSRATGERCVERGMERTRVRVVPNGIHLPRFDAVWQRRQMERPVLEGLPAGAFLCVSVGRQVRRKGFSWFIEQVMPSLPQNVHYWLAGDGPESANIAAAIERAGVGSRVKALGLVDEARLMELYCRADLFVMPNIAVPGDMEGFGVVMLEAGACGVPTLAADMEGIRDVVTDGQNGFFAPSEDASAFAERIQSLLGDPAHLQQVSQRAGALVRERFSWERVAQSYVEQLRLLTPRA